jgi:hypothetical protein
MEDDQDGNIRHSSSTVNHEPSLRSGALRARSEPSVNCAMAFIVGGVERRKRYQRTPIVTAACWIIENFGGSGCRCMCRIG